MVAHPALQDVRPGESERPNVRLVRGVRPVSLVFHFKYVSGHEATRGDAWRHLMFDRANLLERLHRINEIRKDCVLARAVDVLDDGRLADDALKRMQDGEATARGEKWSPRFGGHIEGDQAVRVSGNARFKFELLGGFDAGAARPEDHREVIYALAAAEIADGRMVGSPILIPHDVSNCAQNLVPPVADCPQTARYKIRCQRAGLQHDAFR